MTPYAIARNLAICEQFRQAEDRPRTQAGNAAFVDAQREFLEAGRHPQTGFAAVNRALQEAEAQLAAIRAIVEEAGTHAGRLGRIRQLIEQPHVARV